MKRRLSTTSWVLLLFALPAGACGTRAAPMRDADHAGRVITEAQIARSGATNAWDALRRAGTGLTVVESGAGRPRALGRRGNNSVLLSSAPVVVLDGIKVNDLQTLQKVPADLIFEIRILNGAEGTRRFGTGSGNGVIMITTRT
jgi:outer membrane cobalamin receptor